MKKAIFNKSLKNILLLLTIALCVQAKSENRIDSLEVQLTELSKTVPGLNHPIELTVSKLPLEEFIRNIANLTKLNLNFSSSQQQYVTNNFADVPAKDVLLFLCRYFKLEMEFTGNIIHVKDYQSPIDPYVPKVLKIEVDSISKFVKLDLKHDSLCLLAKQLTKLSGTNIIYEPTAAKKVVSVYVQNLPLAGALDRLAIANNLEIERKDETFVLTTKEIVNQNDRNARRGGNKNDDRLSYKIYDKEHMDVYGTTVPIHSSIETISKELNLNYFITTNLEGVSNLNLTNVSYDEFLENIFKSTAFTKQFHKGIYIIGKRDQEGLREHKIIQFKYRSVKDIINIIPNSFTKEVSIKEFSDLNSLILSGSAPGIKELETFLTKIDKVVPMILIEVMIIDHQSGYTIETGLTAGIGEKPIKSSGQIYPNMDYNMGDQSINSLINSFNGFGALNLGKVNPNFFLNIKALEDEGIIEVQSTPKLSTLNGHEAELKIGNTEYYKEERTDYIINQSTQRNTITQYKEINADFILKLTPFVSGNNEITMSISVEQSDFTTRIEKNAPPGKVTRTFNSLIRVKNEETILLGGLEEKRNSNSGKGVPLLSRVPILKWIFSNRKKEKKESKINVFIKPTIIY